MVVVQEWWLCGAVAGVMGMRCISVACVGCCRDRRYSSLSMSSSSWLKRLSGVSPSRCFPVAVADSAAMVVALPKGFLKLVGVDVADIVGR
jgi:hypothetical protein